MFRAFEIAGYGPEVVCEKFGGMLHAFELGAPPHGGTAPGVDRMVMLLADEPNIRRSGGTVVGVTAWGRAPGIRRGRPP